ncbi:MAG: PilW family protein [Gammaproteobacteria bacterium]
MNRNSQRGFSLVELMVAIVISLFLVAGVVQVYISNKSTYRFGEALSRLQENGRFALDYMATEIRQADFWGCADLTAVQNNLNPSAGWTSFLTAGGVAGTDNPTGTPDVLTIRGALDRGLRLRKVMPDTAAAAFVPLLSGLSQGDIVLLSDCLDGDIFQITNISPGTGGDSDKAALVHNAGSVVSPGNSTHTLSKAYGLDAGVYLMSARTFSVANNPAGEPALFVTGNGGAPQELVDGVEDMQILYGEDTDVPGDGVPNRYVPAGAVADMNAVTAIRVSLLLRSPEDNVLETPQTYTYNGGAPVTAGDRRLRQVYTATINIRNRTR